MKNTLRTLFGLLLSIICSCTSDEQFQEIANVIDKGEAKVTAILPDWNLEEKDSRTSITTGSYPTTPNPVWVTGDSIGIYPDAGGDQLSFRINQGGSKTCTFDGGGWAMKSSSYTAYSPFRRRFYYEKKDALPINMLGQSQKGNDNADHLGAYDIQIAKGEKPEDGSLIFEFGRYVALARLEITAPKAATWTSITLESDALFTTEANMNLTLETPTITPVTTSNSVTLKLANVATTNENLSIIAYMMLLPVDLTGKTLSVKLTDSDENTYSHEASIINNKTNFAANAARWITADFEETIPNNQIWYTSSDGNTITPYATDVFGANITSNVYVDGKGVITFDNDVTSIGDKAFYGYNSSCGYNLTSITIPNSVTSIGNEAFYRCEALNDVALGNSVTSIGNDAFDFCYKLTSITIPNSVTTIGECAFRDCLSLTEFKGKFATEDGYCLIIDDKFHSFAGGSGVTEYTIPDNITAIEKGAFSSCGNITKVTIPNSVITIGQEAFYGCLGLQTITIPNSVTSIGVLAFYYCSGLTSVTIGDNVTEIGGEAFYGCSGLTSINIPNSVTTIGNYAFSSCSKLTNATIPNSVTSIGYYAFSDCSSLTNVYCKAINPPTAIKNSRNAWYTFNNNASGRQIYVPDESIDEYKSAEGWKDYTNYIVADTSN